MPMPTSITTITMTITCSQTLLLLPLLSLPLLPLPGKESGNKGPREVGGSYNDLDAAGASSIAVTVDAVASPLPLPLPLSSLRIVVATAAIAVVVVDACRCLVAVVVPVSVCKTAKSQWQRWCGKINTARPSPGPDSTNAIAL
ncbi:hypothetical protein N9L68_02420 [bacterium]|nr:hypothetical protein [bacterium]